MAYKPSVTARVSTQREGGRAPRTTDIDLPNPGGEVDSRLVDRPIGEYDARRATREMNRPIFSRPLKGRR